MSELPTKKEPEWREEVLYINYHALKLFILKIFKHIFWDGWRYLIHLKLFSSSLLGVVTEAYNSGSHKSEDVFFCL